MFLYVYVWDFCLFVVESVISLSLTHMLSLSFSLSLSFPLPLLSLSLSSPSPSLPPLLFTIGPAPHSQLQLWQFLLELLLISANTHLIQWTEGEFEFQIKSPTEVAQLWGQVTNNPSMNYEKLAIGLRYYYTKGIMSKVPGKRLTFRYAGSIRNYVQMRRSQMVSSHEEIVIVE